MTRATAASVGLGAALFAGCSSEAPTGGEQTGEASQALSSGLVIAEVYGGGGNSGAVYTHDYVVIFNRGTSSVSLNGLYLQYASATGNFTYSATADAGTQDVFALPNVSVAPGKYFLVQLASTAAVGSPLPTPDASATWVALSATNGKVALVSQPLNGCGTTAAPCPTTNVVDFVGYGNTAQQFEGAGAVAVLSNTTAGKRKAGGCIETDNNNQDFETGAPSPKTSATPATDCSAIPDAAADASDGGAVDASDGGAVDAGQPPVGLVIAEVYGGSGNNAPYKNDYVVIFNRGSASASLANVYLQYASATGDFNATNAIALPAASVGAGKYFLVALAEGPVTDGGVGAALPAADHTGGINLSLSAGKVALTHGTPHNACGATACPSAANMLDLVGYGTASWYEGSAAAPAPSIPTAPQRKQGGCQDTNQNGNDFAAVAPAPKNSATPANLCSAQDGGTGGTGGTGTGGSGTGGSGTGGAATGGTGGAATGGAAGAGGASTGGAAGAGGGAGVGTGGGSSGGASSGGASSGGASSGGASFGGNPGTGATGFDGGAGGPSGSGDSGSCGCRTPGGSSHTNAAWAALAGLALIIARRRR